MRYEQKEQRKLDIIINSTDLFITNGYKGTRITDIAKASNMSVGLLFHYYESKEELYIDLIRIATEGTLSAISLDYDSPQDFFCEFTQYLLKLIEKQPYIAKIFVLLKQASCSGEIPEGAKRLAKSINYLPIILSYIKQGQNEKVVRGGSSDALATLYWASLQGIIEYYACYPKVILPDYHWITDMILIEKKDR